MSINHASQLDQTSDQLTCTAIKTTVVKLRGYIKRVICKLDSPFGSKLFSLDVQ